MRPAITRVLHLTALGSCSMCPLAALGMAGGGAMAITPDGKIVLAAAAGGHVVTPVHTATNKAGRPISVGLGPIAVVITPNGTMAYVANFGNGRVEGHTVAPIRIATLRAGRAIKVGHGPHRPRHRALTTSTSKTGPQPLIIVCQAGGWPRPLQKGSRFSCSAR